MAKTLNKNVSMIKYDNPKEFQEQMLQYYSEF